MPWLVAVAGLAVGCGENNPADRFVPVAGKVTIADRPLHKGEVVFVPDTSRGNGHLEYALEGPDEIEASAVALFAVLFVASVITVSRNLNSVTPILEMPFWLFFAPLVAGSLLLVVETLAMLAHTWRARRPEAKQTVLS